VIRPTLGHVQVLVEMERWCKEIPPVHGVMTLEHVQAAGEDYCLHCKKPLVWDSSGRRSYVFPDVVIDEEEELL